MAAVGKWCDAILWWSYRRIDWWRRVLTKRITFLGGLVLGMVFLSGALGTDVLRNGLGLLFCFGAFLLFVEFLSLCVRRNKLTIRNGLIPIVNAGSQTSIPFHVSVKSKVKRCQLALYPTTKGVGFTEFYEGREPCEEKRNIVDRFLKFYRWRWLNEERAFSTRETTILDFEAGEERQVLVEAEFFERGVWSLVDTRVKLLGVFGLLKRSCKTDGKRTEVYVAPKVYPISVAFILGAGKAEELAMETRPQVGESQEFLSMREYRPGDSWRKVNWKAMARTEKAMVQEYEEFAVPSYTVRWNTEGMNREEFETAASVVASLVRHYVHEDQLGQVVIEHGEGVQAFDWTVQYEEVMQALAMIRQNDVWEGNALPTSDIGYVYTVAKEGEGHLLQVESDRVNGINLEEGIMIS